jgi:crotonobetainyl-CoA:carnitine CoA-transferase CaiB-like acyl-CoA transferase
VSKEEKSEGMLSPYRILDLTDERGLYCGQLLGNLGADVIKIEKPGGDPVRNIAPFFHDTPDPEKSLYWFAFNTNKRGITLDIETAAGRELFKSLAKTADVIIESFPPGHMDELGLSYAELEKINTRIIVTSITPFGQTGPYRDYKASDLVCWATSGLLFVTGDPDKPPVHVSHIPLSFLLGGMDGAWGTAIALYWRRTSGEGQHIDVAIQDSASKTAWMIHERWEVTGKEFQRGSSRYNIPNSEVVVRMVWPAMDGYIMYMLIAGLFGVAESQRLVKWLDDEEMADDFLRGIDWATLDWINMSREEGDRIQDYFARFFQSKTKTELLEGAIKRRIMVQPVNTPRDIATHPQLEARDYWQKVDHADLGIALHYPSRFCLLSDAPCNIWRRAPLIGEHNQEIYQKELGLSSKELDAFKQAGII